MRVNLIISVCMLVVGMIACQSSKPEAILHKKVANGLDKMLEMLDDELMPAIETGSDDAIMQHLLKLRLQFKAIEDGVEYFMPATAKGINGAPIPEVELEGNTEIPPNGLQVIEAALATEDGTEKKAALTSAAGNLRGMLERARQIWAVQMPSQEQWWDAIYYETIRIAAQGIAGFDTPATGTGISESVIAIQAFAEKIKLLDNENKSDELLMKLDNAIAYAKKHTDFNRFDRAAFLRQHWQPIFAEIASIRKTMLPVTTRTAIDKNATTFFGPEVMNVSFYTFDSIGAHELLASLGEKLFYDTRLSKNENFSCATCHNPETYFTENKALSNNIHGTPLARNTPSLVNTAYQTNYFWDMRTHNLEMQAQNVIDNQFEMHGSLKEVTELLRNDAALQKQVEQVFATDDQLSEQHIVRALAAYQRKLVGHNSAFDDYMNGNDNAVSQDAVAGFNLFMGKGKCGTCHFMPTFSGLVPPFFDKMESEVLGTPATAANKSLDSDKGRGELYPANAYMHAFKTPTVRNVAKTYPYMHNGAYNTLEEVVDFYNKGGGAGLGFDVPNQTLPFDSLQLTPEEQKQLVVFMKSLTDRPISNTPKMIAAR